MTTRAFTDQGQYLTPLERGATKGIEAALALGDPQWPSPFTVARDIDATLRPHLAYYLSSPSYTEEFGDEFAKRQLEGSWEMNQGRGKATSIDRFAREALFEWSYQLIRGPGRDIKLRLTGNVVVGPLTSIPTPLVEGSGTGVARLDSFTLTGRNLLLRLNSGFTWVDPQPVGWFMYFAVPGGSEHSRYNLSNPTNATVNGRDLTVVLNQHAVDYWRANSTDSGFAVVFTNELFNLQRNAAIDITISPTIGQEANTSWINYITRVIRELLRLNMSIENIYISNRFQGEVYLRAAGKTTIVDINRPSGPVGGASI